MLVERIVPTSAAAALRQRATALPPIVLDSRETANLELIACGAATPLTGFLRSTDYLNVLERMRLTDGTIWPIPMTLAVDAAVARRRCRPTLRPMPARGRCSTRAAVSGA